MSNGAYKNIDISVNATAFDASHNKLATTSVVHTKHDGEELTPIRLKEYKVPDKPTIVGHSVGDNTCDIEFEVVSESDLKYTDAAKKFVDVIVMIQTVADNISKFQYHKISSTSISSGSTGNEYRIKVRIDGRIADESNEYKLTNNKLHEISVSLDNKIGQSTQSDTIKVIPRNVANQLTNGRVETWLYPNQKARILAEKDLHVAYYNAFKVGNSHAAAIAAVDNLVAIRKPGLSTENACVMHVLFDDDDALNSKTTTV